MLGTDKLKVAVKLGVALFNQAKESTADGFQVMDVFSFVDELAQLPEVIKSAEDMRAELNDLDMAERQEILALVKEQLNVTDERAEEIVVTALDLVFALYKGVTLLGKQGVN
jgi:hypothetical protein